MTGFGSARREENGLRIQVDLRSVNNRFFDCQCRISRELQFLEGEVCERVRKVAARGRVNIQISFEAEEGGAQQRISPQVLKSYLEALDTIETQGGFKERGSAVQFMALPELFSGSDEGPGRDDLKDLTMSALEEGLGALMEMREREGRTLATELKQRLDLIDGALTRIETMVPEARAQMQANLETRVQELLGEVALDPQRLAQELAILVDRGDITEETVRLRSHLGQFGDLLGTGGEVSKKLGFILQEILRETNTIGSKAQALSIVKEVLSIKEETEKLREQILNLE